MGRFPRPMVQRRMSHAPAGRSLPITIVMFSNGCSKTRTSLEVQSAPVCVNGKIPRSGMARTPLFNRIHHFLFWAAGQWPYAMNRCSVVPGARMGHEANGADDTHVNRTSGVVNRMASRRPGKSGVNAGVLHCGFSSTPHLSQATSARSRNGIRRCFLCPAVLIGSGILCWRQPVAKREKKYTVYQLVSRRLLD